MITHIFFQGWEPIVKTAVGTVATYLVLIVLLRIAGQRSLAKWYAFDLIVTVALGSTFANAVVSNDISILQAVMGFLILLGLQFAVSFTVLHWAPMKTIVNSPPTLVLFEGRFQREGMRSQRVSEADIRAALRQNGNASLSDAAAVVLEADGTFSVIGRIGDAPSALIDIPEFARDPRVAPLLPAKQRTDST